MNGKAGFWSAFGAFAGGFLGAKAAQYATQYAAQPRSHRYDEDDGDVEIGDATILGGITGAVIGAFVGGAVGGKESPQLPVGTGAGALGAAEPSFEDIVSAVAPTSELEQVDVYGSAPGTTLTEAQLQAPLSGLSLAACGVPDSMGVTVRMAVKHGRAIGVTVETSPANAAIASCVNRAVRKLQWAPSSKLETLTTQY